MRLSIRTVLVASGAFLAASMVAACNNNGLTTTPAPAPSVSYTPGPIVASPYASPVAFTLSVSQGTSVNLLVTQLPGNPPSGIGTPMPLWPPKTDTCTNVYTRNGTISNQSIATQTSYTVSQVLINAIQGIKAGTCSYGFSDGGSNSLVVGVTVNP